MKKYLLLGLIGIVSLYASAPAAAGIAVTSAPTQGDKELAWVDEQIQAILPSRIGIADGVINSLRDPMKMAKPAPKVSTGLRLMAPPPKLGTSGIIAPPKIVEEPLRLQAIMNKAVLINGKWYRVGDAVRDQSLVEIKSNSVLLIGKKGHKLILFLTKPSNKIQITTK